MIKFPTASSCIRRVSMKESEADMIQKQSNITVEKLKSHRPCRRLTKNAMEFDNNGALKDALNNWRSELNRYEEGVLSKADCAKHA